MRFYISPFGYISYKILLAVAFTMVAILILFFDVIVKMTLVGVIGFLGWIIGSLIDDKALFARWKFKIRNAFSGKGN